MSDPVAGVQCGRYQPGKSDHRGQLLCRYDGICHSQRVRLLPVGLRSSLLPARLLFDRHGGRSAALATAASCLRRSGLARSSGTTLHRSSANVAAVKIPDCHSASAWPWRESATDTAQLQARAYWHPDSGY